MPTDVLLTLRLRDRNAPVVEAWRRHFGDRANVEIGFGDIFETTADAIGAMPAERCARQMWFAYDVILGGRKWPPLRPKEIYEVHEELLR